MNQLRLTRLFVALATVAIGAAIILSSCARGPEAAEEAIPAGTENTPAPTTPPVIQIGRAVAADGQLASHYPNLALGFGGDVSGEVLTITVRPGDTVQAGDPLALLDATDLERAVDDAHLALERATADREQALEQWEQDVADAEQSLAAAERALSIARLDLTETDLEEARTNLDRARQAEADAQRDYENVTVFWPPINTEPFYESWQRAIRDRELAEMRLADAEDAHGVAHLELEGLEEDVAQAERDLAALEGGVEPSYDRAVEDAEQELADAEEALRHARLTAPWAAIVLSVDVAPGASINAGTAVVTLLNVEDGLHFVTQNLSEQHIAAIRPGQRAVVTLRTFATTPLEGTVEAAVPLISDDSDDDARFAVHVRLPPTDLALLPGLTGRVEIFTEE
jgi:HlyD family secretion protein